MSASITVDVSGALAAIDPAKMERAIASALGDAASLVRAEAKVYPQPPLPSYQRTFTLFKGWAQEVNASKMQAIIGNDVKYGRYVQDSERQAWMHRGRWQTTADIARKMAPEVKRTIEQALSRWAR